MPVLAPGADHTRTGRLWTYVRDERGHNGEAVPAVLFRYAPHRKGERPAEHLRAFRGDLHADGYFGVDRLYGERIAEVACWAHVGASSTTSMPRPALPSQREARDHIAGLYAAEGDVRGRPPEERRPERQARAGPLLDQLRCWLDTTLLKLSRRSDLAIGIRYALARWPTLVRYVDNGRLEIDNNAAERSLRGIAIGRKNWLFAGSDQGDGRAASIFSLVETAKLNGVDP